MALNEIFKIGKSISLPVSAGIKSGDPVRVGVLNGVAIVDEGSGFNADGYTSVDLFGGHLFEIEDAGAADVGDAVYITSAGALTLTATSNKLYGAITHKHRGDEVVVLVQSISV